MLNKQRQVLVRVALELRVGPRSIPAVIWSSGASFARRLRSVTVIAPCVAEGGVALLWCVLAGALPRSPDAAVGVACIAIAYS